MVRYNIINHFINKFGYKNYLEIGVARKEWCFNHVQADKKTSVDPGYEIFDETYDYKMESDLFFRSVRGGGTEFSTDHKWDIIFIDGLHLAEQVEIDVLNSLEHLSPNGTILMHDCSPPNEMIARETYTPSWPHPDEWCGTVWKAFYKLRQTRTDLEMTCVDTDWGVGIIRRGKQKLAPADNPYYSFAKFNSNRKEYLNLISPEEFLQRF
jgi:hypothetical protein